jgi:DegV family protein with EDD domain
MPLQVRIVTDSTSNLPRELLEQYAIGVVPVLVIFGRQTYRENVDITLPEFYDRVERTGEVPSASQPSPGAFVDVYTKLLQEAGDCQLLSIHLTGRLSGVLASARLAAEMLPQADIALFDSQSVSMGLGFCVLEAARMAAQGASRDEIVARLEQVRDRLNIFLTPATLRYLQSSGRVGRLQGHPVQGWPPGGLRESAHAARLTGPHPGVVSRGRRGRPGGCCRHPRQCAPGSPGPGAAT